MLGYLLQVEDPIYITDKKEYNKKICKEQLKKLIEFYIYNSYGKEQLIESKSYWIDNRIKEIREEQEIATCISYILGLTDYYHLQYSVFNEIDVGMFMNLQFERYRKFKESIINDIQHEFHNCCKRNYDAIETLHDHMKSIRKDLILYKKCFDIYDSVESLFNHLKETEPMLKRYNECLELYKQNFKEATK